MKIFVMEYLVLPVLTVCAVIQGFFIGIKLGVLLGMGKISEEEFYDRIRKYVYGDEE